MAIERLALLLALAAGLAVLVVVTRWWARGREMRLRSDGVDPLWRALGAEPDGRPAVVAFSTPSCGVCRSAQAPALAALERRLGAGQVRVLRVDAAEHTEVARAFGVLTVPSTVVLGSGGVAAVNHGFAPVERLANQVAAACPA